MGRDPVHPVGIARKRPPPPGETSASASPNPSMIPLDDQGTADRILQAWMHIWGDHHRDPAARSYWHEANSMPRITVLQLRQAAASIKAHTAIGADCIHPRWLSWLSDECLTALIGLFELIERWGRIPNALRLVLLAFLPKPEGGLRPIGILPTVIRIWAKARSRQALAWEEANRRSFFWGVKGKSSVACVWDQSLYAEAARARGLISASVLLDMVKCYEKVAHVVLAAKAQLHGFPMHIIRVVIAMYSSPRVVKIGAECSLPVSLGTTIVAGCTFATTLLKLVLLKALDLTSAAHNLVRLKVYVDDASVQARGLGDRAAKLVAAATRDLIEELQKPEVGLVVSTSKTHGVATNPTLGRQLAARLAASGLTTKSHTKNLGVDFAAGGRRRTGVRQERFHKLRGRLHRFAALEGGAPSGPRRREGVQSWWYSIGPAWRRSNRDC